MSYFIKFPTINLSVDNTGDTKETVNIFRRTAVLNSVRTNTSLYEHYYIQDGETPEGLANKFYDDASLHWVILLFNNIRDANYDWPLSYHDLNRFVEKKYGSTEKYSTHHYENNEGFQVLSTAPFAKKVDNYGHEEELNEKKRLIKILKLEFLTDFISDFQDQIR